MIDKSAVLNRKGKRGMKIELRRSNKSLLCVICGEILGHYYTVMYSLRKLVGVYFFLLLSALRLGIFVLSIDDSAVYMSTWLQTVVEMLVI